MLRISLRINKYWLCAISFYNKLLKIIKITEENMASFYYREQMLKFFVKLFSLRIVLLKIRSDL